MSTINGVNETNPPVYNNSNQAGSSSDQGSGSDFSNVLNDAIKEQALKSVMERMGSPSGGSPGSGFSESSPMSSTMGGLGGTNAMLGGLGSLGGTNAMLSGLGGLGGTNAMLGMGGIGGMGGPAAFMPSISSGMENTLISAAGTGEMSGAQLALFMMIMMMQSGSSGGGSDMMPIMQMLAGLLTQFTNDASAGRPNNMIGLGDMQEGSEHQSDIQRMIDAALSQVGYQERNRDGSVGNGNITQFGAWYGMNGQPWCAMFVSWAADQAGILHNVVPRHASTSQGVAAYQERGLYAASGSGYQPREGDSIYFQGPNGQIRHVGIVVAFDPGTQRVYTVEGNTNNAVRIRHYDLSSRQIHGFGRNGGTGFGRIPVNSTTGVDADIT
ncbi:MAG: CHAP domain-containing protein [Oscillospiraceae bacterium]|nr:CHAP domain-containing protein [Oscillospiraceae bacterium]